jgi:hypothetical protein
LTRRRRGSRLTCCCRRIIRRRWHACRLVRIGTVGLGGERRRRRRATANSQRNGCREQSRANEPTMIGGGPTEHRANAQQPLRPHSPVIATVSCRSQGQAHDKTNGAAKATPWDLKRIASCRKPAVLRADSLV